MFRSNPFRIVVCATLTVFATTALAAERAAPDARPGLKVHMDPATNTVVDEAPASAEARATSVERDARIPKPDYNRMTTSTNARGTVLLNLNGQVRMYSVATVKPSGEIEHHCATGAAHEHHHGDERATKAR